MKRYFFLTGILFFLFPTLLQSQINKKKKEVLLRPTICTVYKMPEFIGDLKYYLDSTGLYPIEAREKNQQGRPIVQFEIGKEGEVTNVCIKRTSGFAPLDSEAVRIIKLMPNWKAGLKAGKKDTFQYLLPITFSLSEI